MPEMLEVIETIEQESADVRRLFSGDGEAVRNHPRSRNPQYAANLLEAVRLIADVQEGRRPMHLLEAAMTTSDFPLLFGDVLDRQLLANYAETTPTWSNYCGRSTVRDFRPAKRFAVDGLEGELTDVAERAPYPQADVDETSDSITVRKLGRKTGFSWETMINDDLGAFASFPERLARAARRTEELEVTRLFVGAAGPQTDLYKATPAARRNIVSGNPALTAAGLEAAFTLLASMTDEDGAPIVIDAAELVVPPALMVTANNLLNADSIEVTDGSTVLKVANWMRNKVRLSVNPYIPTVATTNGNTSWFLFANPATSRRAIELAFLRGHESPALFRKAPNATAVGGGAVDAAQGDFDTDSIEYKVRHVLGGARFVSTGGWRATVMSNGSGS